MCKEVITGVTLFYMCYKFYFLNIDYVLHVNLLYYNINTQIILIDKMAK